MHVYVYRTRTSHVRNALRPVVYMYMWCVCIVNGLAVCIMCVYNVCVFFIIYIVCMRCRALRGSFSRKIVQQSNAFRRNNNETL